MIDLVCKHCEAESAIDEQMINCPGCGKAFATGASIKEEINDLRTHVEVVQHLYSEYTEHVNARLKTLSEQLAKIQRTLDDLVEHCVDDGDFTQVH